MVENYPTALRSLVLAENSISPELQQQICDLLSEGEEEEEVAGGPGDTQERERAREPAAHQRSSSSWTGPSGKIPQGLIGGLRPGRRGGELRPLVCGPQRRDARRSEHPSAFHRSQLSDGANDIRTRGQSVG